MVYRLVELFRSGRFTLYCYCFVQGGLQISVIVSFRAVYSIVLLFRSAQFTEKCYCFVQGGYLGFFSRLVYSLVLLLCSGRFTVYCYCFVQGGLQISVIVSFRAVYR